MISLEVLFTSNIFCLTLTKIWNKFEVWWELGPEKIKKPKSFFFEKTFFAGFYDESFERKLVKKIYSLLIWIFRMPWSRRVLCLSFSEPRGSLWIFFLRKSDLSSLHLSCDILNLISCKRNKSSRLRHVFIRHLTNAPLKI